MMSIRIIHRGPANRAIERLQLLPNIAQIKETVDPAQQMIVGNVILQEKPTAASGILLGCPRCAS
jgi:hypothetical protein